MPGTLTKRQWLKVAEDFERRWDFPHVIGAVDGKHIAVQVFKKVYCHKKMYHTFLHVIN